MGIDAITSLATGFALAASAGVNAFLPLFFLGLVTRVTNSGYLASPYSIIAESWFLGILLILLLAELIADKLPGVEILNDAIQTVVRPVSGGLLMLAVMPPDSQFPPALLLAFGIVVAGIAHAAKVGFRPMVTVHSGGRAGPMVSAVEDTVATICVFLALIMPLANILITPVLLFGLFWGLHRQWDHRIEDHRAGPPPELMV
jgi:hypothetical protein